jgi:hypothetical protein
MEGYKLLSVGIDKLYSLPIVVNVKRYDYLLYYDAGRSYIQGFQRPYFPPK